MEGGNNRESLLWLEEVIEEENVGTSRRIIYNDIDQKFTKKFSD